MEILQQIIEIDKAAAARVNMAIEEERRLVDEFCKEQTAKLNEKLSKADKTLADECGKLDEKFNSRKADWKTEIIGRITEG